MKSVFLAAFLLLLAVAGLSGCGAAGGESFEAGNRLVVTSITDTADNSGPIFYAVEETDDSGLDGDADTDDEGEQDGFPQQGESVVTLLMEDVGEISLANQARLGTDPGVDLQVNRVDLTYYDAAGLRRDFAPTKVYNLTATVPNNGSSTIQVGLVPVEMKSAENGLRSIFLYGTSAEIARVRSWTVVVDVYARDIQNNRTVHAQGQTTVRFINPMTEQIVNP